MKESLVDYIIRKYLKYGRIPNSENHEATDYSNYYKNRYFIYVALNTESRYASSEYDTARDRILDLQPLNSTINKCMDFIEKYLVHGLLPSHNVSLEDYNFYRNHHLELISILKRYPQYADPKYDLAKETIKIISVKTVSIETFIEQYLLHGKTVDAKDPNFQNFKKNAKTIESILYSDSRYEDFKYDLARSTIYKYNHLEDKEIRTQKVIRDYLLMDQTPSKKSDDYYFWYRNKKDIQKEFESGYFTQELVQKCIYVLHEFINKGLPIPEHLLLFYREHKDLMAHLLETREDLSNMETACRELGVVKK